MSKEKPLPPTKDGYRYHFGEDDEELCKKYIRLFNSIDQNKRTNNHQPVVIKRKVISSKVKLSENDRAPQLKLNDDYNRVTGEKGYSMVRATHGINRGKFYYEVHIESMPGNTATRIGWGQCYANLQAPLGYDHYGYSWRSRFGTKFHQARGKTFDKNGGYRQGDTIGCMIELPYENAENRTLACHLPPSIKQTCAVVPAKKKDTGIRSLEEQDHAPPLAEMRTLIGSKITFYKNGTFVGVAFEDIFSGFYYPTISLYKTCSVSINFGPHFKYPPTKCQNDTDNHIGYKPASDIAEISIIDHLISDMMFVIDKEMGDSGSNEMEDAVKKLIPS